MSIHADPRQYSADPDERADWERDLRFEYAREEYEQRHPYEAEYEDEGEDEEE